MNVWVQRRSTTGGSCCENLDPFFDYFFPLVSAIFLVRSKVLIAEFPSLSELFDAQRNSLSKFNSRY